jgi:glycosyltransferase involved in cell wall biosynthesis
MTPPLVIALVGQSWGTSDSGGATFENEILHAVLGTSSAHRFLVYPSSKRLAAFVKESGLSDRVTLVKAVKSPRLPRRVLRKAVRMVRRRPPPLPFSALSDTLKKHGAQCAWMLGGTLVPLDMPYVATIWDAQHRVQPWFPEVSAHGEWRERERLYAEYVGRAAAVITGTEVGAHELRNAYGDVSGALQVVPMPTPSFAIAAGLRPRPGRPSDVPARYLLYPAQFWPHKNHITAVRVIAALNRMQDPPELICVGADKGTKEHVMREANALGVGHRVHAPGFVDQSRLVSLYRHADALLYPSLFGPDNLPPLEAMALGCPVVAARVEGADEQLGKAAVLVEPFNVEGYVDAIRRLREEPYWHDALVELGRERARSWTTQQYVHSVLGLIQSRIAPARALWA